MALGYLYLITNNINGKTYVGMRVNKAFSIEKDEYLGSGILIKKAVSCYGKEAFTKTILLYGEMDRKTLGMLEKHYIAYYKALGKAEYNIALGGEGGNLGEAVNKRIAASSKNTMANPLNRKRISDKLKGHVYSEERNKRCSMSHIGMKWYNNGSTETQARECPTGFIDGRLNKKPKKPLLSKTERSKIISEAVCGAKNPRAIPVVCVELNRTFTYIKEAVYYLISINAVSGSFHQCHITKISNCCKGITPTAFGYTWKFHS